MTQHVHISSDPADFKYMEKNVPCQSACPARTNVPAYIRALFEKDCGVSYAINRDSNVLPGVLGRICSRPCEHVCRHGEGELGKPVNICHLKRAAADFSSLLPPAEPASLNSGKRVAVIGSGPAGLAAAHDLCLAGVSVTVIEALDHPGGMLRYGIPEFRLPRDVLNREINNVLNLGVRLQTGVRVGRDVTLDSLASEYDAVLLAAGCYGSRRMGVPGEDLDGVWSGLDFMIAAADDRIPRLGKRVLVLGGGFTAFDCGRMALRLGAEQVSICIRRTEEDLRVTEDEIFQTKTEGISVQALTQARRILGDRGVTEIELVRTRLEPQGAGNRPRILPIEDSAYVLPADTVIVAVGQEARLIPFGMELQSSFPGYQLAPSFRTSIPNLYAAGDYATGPSTVIEAVAAGRHAAETVIRDLTGKRFRNLVVRQTATTITDRHRSWDFLPRQDMPTLSPVDQRVREPRREVEVGFSEEQAQEEARRCYLCYLHYEIDVTRCIYCRYCIDVAPRNCIRLVEAVHLDETGAVEEFTETTDWSRVHAVVIDNGRCIRCGECMRVCPVDCISVTRVELVEESAREGETG